MMVKPFLFKTLKWSEKEQTLATVGVQVSAPPSEDGGGGDSSVCRIEVVLDMGACHTTCKRGNVMNER